MQAPPSFLPPPPDQGPDDADDAPWPDRRTPADLQNLLLGLGTALVAVAVIVFTAVNWNQLDAGVQGLVLAGVTVAAAVGGALASKRSMPSTAEALGLVALLLAIADVHAFRVGFAPAADPMAYWAGGLALVSVAGGLLGRAGRIRSPQVAAAGLVQLPLLFVLAAVDAPIATRQLAVVAQALVLLVAADRVAGPRWAGIVARSWSLLTAAGFTAAVVIDTAFTVGFGERGEDPHFGATAACLGAAALLSLLLAGLRPRVAAIRVPALLAATAAALAAVWFAGLQVAEGDVAVALVAVAGAAVVLGTRFVPRTWGEGPAFVGATAVGLALLPLLAAVSSMLIAASTVSDRVWDRSGAIEAASLQLRSATVPSTTGLLLSLGALILTVLAVARSTARWVTGAAAAVSLLIALAVSPLVVPLTITATVLMALAAVLVAVLAAAIVGGRSDGFPVLLGFGAMAYAWATPWSLATPTLTFVTLAVGIAGALVVAVISRRDEAAEVGVVATTWVAAAVPLLLALIAWDRGVSAAGSWAAASVAAAAVSVVGVLLLGADRRPVRSSVAMSTALELMSLVAYVCGLVVAASRSDAQAASVALAAGVVGFGLHSVRPQRRAASLIAGIEALIFTWVQLGEAGVGAIEAYTVPLAVLLLAVGVVAERLDRSALASDDAKDGSTGAARPSWITYGPALVVGLAPTVWLSFTEPHGLRPLLGLVAGAMVLVGGAVWGKRAFVDVGTATVVVLGLRQIAPVVGSMPNWATIGGTGLLLLAVGATFEQRRRDLKAVVERYSALT